MSAALRQFLNKMKHGEPIVVISGLPRSGTSMSMKMLEAGGLDVMQDGIRAADDDNPKGYFEYERVKALDKSDDKSWVKTARGKVIKVISYLLPHLPDDNRYKVLFVHREYAEVLASQARMLERRGETSDVDDQQMIKVYDKHLAEVKRILDQRPCFDVLYQHYTKVQQDPMTAARRIEEFLGLGLDVEAMAGAVDPDLWRNRAAEAASS